MRQPTLIDFGLLLALLLPPAARADDRVILTQAGKELMAQSGSGQDAVPGRDVLVAGVGAVIDGQAPTRVRIDIGTGPVPTHAKLELLLSPSEVVANEAYLIAVEAGNDAPARRLGAASFYPPKAGTAQAFYFDAAPLLADMKARAATSVDLTLLLVPADKAQKLTSSKVRLLGARLVGD
jgi:hypothetical protein